MIFLLFWITPLSDRMFCCMLVSYSGRSGCALTGSRRELAELLATVPTLPTYVPRSLDGQTVLPSILGYEESGGVTLCLTGGGHVCLLITASLMILSALGPPDVR